MTDPLPFKKPSAKVRLERPDKQQREYIIQEALNLVAAMEKDEEIVGFGMVFLLDDGSRRSTFNCMKPHCVQLSKQMRCEAALVAKEALKS